MNFNSKMSIMQVVLFCIALSLFMKGCSGTTERSTGYLNPEATVNERVEDLLKQMTLEEKVGQMCQFVGIEHIKAAEKNLTKEEMDESDAHGFYPALHSSEVEKMVEQGIIGSFLHVVDVKEANHLQSLAQKSRLKIPLLIGVDAIHGTGLVNGATIYPTPIGLASTWDTALVRKLSTQTALEMRATGSSWTFTPNIDVARDARWGRVGETFGEDPFLVGEMGASMINGLQETDSNGNLISIACAKHLIAGSESVNGINGAPTDLSERTIREIYLPPYQRAIDENVFSIMTAHNELNGIPCHSDEWMMEKVIRSEMGFKGFYVSDWMDIERLHTKHKTAENQKEACYQTLTSGMDMHMHGPQFLQPVVELVKEGRLSEERVNESVRRILEVKFKLGLFENTIVSEDQTSHALFKSEHQATALEVAEKSLILLENKNKILPLKKGKYKRILLTGPNANNQTVLGDWALKQPENNVVTVLEGLQELDKNAIHFVSTGNHVNQITEKQIQTVAETATQSDLAIVVLGSNSMRWDWNNKTCGENSARSEITLIGRQLELVQRIKSTGIPVVVVLINGRPLATPWISENIDALIEAWEPGSLGGLAIANLVYGLTNASGKLTISIPRSSGQLLTVYNHKPTHTFHKYIDAETAPLYPFGYGLSYSRFLYQNLQIKQSELKKGKTTSVSIEVINTGSRKGDEVIQLYIRDEFSSVTRPVKELKAFRRLSLNPGETKQVSFSITPEMLTFLDKSLKPIIETGKFTIYVGSSSLDRDLHQTSLTIK